MEIDLGGIGKEHAVDRSMALARKQTEAPVLINLGGDLRISGPRHDGSGWRVGIEDAVRANMTAGLVEFSSGALATSGDRYRHVASGTVRYGHVLNAKTGWSTATLLTSSSHWPACTCWLPYSTAFSGMTTFSGACGR